MMTEDELLRAVEELLSKRKHYRRETISEITGGRPLDEFLTDVALSVVQEDLMSFSDFRRDVERNKDSEEFLSGWVVLSREALRNFTNLLVRDGIGMTHNFDEFRDIVKDLNLKPEDPTPRFKLPVKD